MAEITRISSLEKCKTDVLDSTKKNALSGKITQLT